MTKVMEEMTYRCTAPKTPIASETLRGGTEFLAEAAFCARSQVPLSPMMQSTDRILQVITKMT